MSDTDPPDFDWRQDLLNALPVDRDGMMGIGIDGTVDFGRPGIAMDGNSC